MNAVRPIAQEPSENVGLDMADADGDPPDVEPATDSSVGEAHEAGVPPESSVEEMTSPSTEPPLAVLSPPSSSHHYSARDRQPPT